MKPTLTRHEARRYSLAKVIADLSEGPMKPSFEREVAEQLARDRGVEFDGLGPSVPFEILMRDMTTANTGAVVAVDTPTAIDALFAESAVGAAGVQPLPGQVANITLPRVTTAVDPVWLADEASVVTASQPVLGSVAMAPKLVGGLVTYSKQLRTQVETLEPVLRAHLTKVLARAVDKAVLAGSGASGQPTGLSIVAGTLTQSGTSLAWAGVVNMLQQAADASAADSRIAFITTPSVRELLQTREQAAGSGLVWASDGTMAGKRAFATPDAPSASLFCGDFSNIVVPIWGPGIELAVDAYTGFTTGKVSIRALLALDVGHLQPQAFCKSTSIT